VFGLWHLTRELQELRKQNAGHSRDLAFGIEDLCTAVLLFLPFRQVVLVTIGLFAVLAIVRRLIPGIHWLTDMIGAILPSAGILSQSCASNYRKSL